MQHLGKLLIGLIFLAVTATQTLALERPVANGNVIRYQSPREFRSFLGNDTLGCYRVTGGVRGILSRIRRGDLADGAVSLRPISRASLERQLRRLGTRVGNRSRRTRDFILHQLELREQCIAWATGAPLQPSPAPSDSPTPAPESPTPLPTGSVSPTPSLPPSASPSVSATPAASATPTPSATATPSPSATATATPTPSPTASASPTPTSTPTPSGNTPPIANAGPDQTVSDANLDGYHTVTLNGTASSDPGGSISTYIWLRGTTEIGRGSMLNAVFGIGSTVITLRVIDNLGATSTDTVTINVTSPGATQIQKDGITWRFASARPIGRYVNGDYWVIGPVAISEILPKTVQQTVDIGGGNQGLRWIHGSQINVAAANLRQGFDERYAPANEQGFIQSYDPSLNVARLITPSTPLQLSAGDKLMSVASFATLPPWDRPYLSDAAVLTVVTSAPAFGSFRPPYSGTGSTSQFTESQLDYNALTNLPLPNNAPNPAIVAQLFSRVRLDHWRQWSGRYMQPLYNSSDYGRDIAADYGVGALTVLMNFSLQQKREIVIGMVQLGIDYYSHLLNGSRWPGLGGHGQGRKLPILFAGRLLNNAAMLSIGQNYVSFRNPASPPGVEYFSEDAQVYTVQQTSPGVINEGYGNFTNAYIGLPEFGFAHVSDTPADTYRWINPDVVASSYRLCCSMNGWAGNLLAAKIMGLRSAWNNETLFRYADRYFQVETDNAWRAWISERAGAAVPAYTNFILEMINTHWNQYGPVWNCFSQYSNMVCRGAPRP